MSKPIIVSVDEVKKSLPHYNPNKSHLTHRKAAKLADDLYDKTVNESIHKNVILLSGGSASGKTEFISEYLTDKSAIIVDTTSPSFEGIKIKSKKALKLGKSVELLAVWPEDFTIAFAAFLERERKFPEKYFYETHSNSRKALLEAATSELDIEISIYISSYNKENQQLNYAEVELGSQSEKIEYIRNNQYTIDEIKETVST